LAERVGVDDATIRRWEQGEVSPQGRNKWKLMKALEVSSEEELDLGPKSVEKPVLVLHSLTRHSRVAHLVILVFSDSNSALDLQCEVRASLERLLMDPISRREALYTLAAIPLAPQLLSTDAVTKSADEILRRCAAGIVACEQLSKGNGEDMREASKTLTSYLPILETIAKSSPSLRRRKTTLTLMTQICIRKAVLASHLAGTKLAATYAKQAVEYAEQSDDTELTISALVWHAWALFYNGQMSSAMETALRAKHLVEHTDGLSALTCSSVHAVAAQYQAANGLKYKDEALATLKQARNNFQTASKSNEKTMYLDNTLDVLMLVDGMVHFYTGDSVSAYDIFSKVIDPDSLQPKIDFSSERLRIEAINDLTLASLKLPGPKKDKERSIYLWKAGLQGAMDLRSEKRLNEAVIAYHIMEALWEDDEEIREMRELIVHW
jgi:transcriptional regulator with XRE-family HTH domain